MKRCFLGLDIGTSACRAALFDLDGTVLAHQAVACGVQYAPGGVAEQNPEDWYDALCKAIPAAMQKAGVAAEQIAGVGLDGQSWATVMLDRQGQVLCPTPIWLDTRSDAICRQTVERIGQERLFSVCGNPLMPGYCTGKALWFRQNRPEIYEKTDCILQSNGYIVYRLTGQKSQDLSQGYGWHFFDMRRGCWDEKLADEIGIDLEKLPPVMACHQVAGQVSEKAAKETGLLPGTPVVAGGLDAACGTLGAGVLHAGQVQEQGGQAGGMSICAEEYYAHPKLILGYHVVPGRWLLQGGSVGGGGVLKWFEQEFGQPERNADGSPNFDALGDLAQTVPAGAEGVVFLPYMAGERSPIWNSHAKGVYFGLSYAAGRAHMLRACMESVAYSLRHNFETAQETGIPIGELYAMGGSANSRFWTQLKADVTGRTIHVPSTDSATTHGAAMLAMVGTGAVSSFEEAAKGLQIKRTHVPQPCAAYEKTYQTYLELYRHLQPMMCQ